MKIISLFIFLFSLSSYAKYDPCKYLNYGGCGNSKKVNTSVGSSQPSSSRSFSAPSAIGSVKGLGVEMLVWDGADFSIVTGNGRVGAGATTSNSDDTFFGNTSKEQTDDYIQRKSSKEKYKFKKYSFGFGANLLDEGVISVNAGIIVKYVDPTSNFHFGAGASAMIGPINLSYGRYKDEGQNFSTLNGVNTSKEFFVDTYSIGLSLGLLSLDYTVFNNDTAEVDKVSIYSGALSLEGFILSYGVRKVESSLPEVSQGQEHFINSTEKHSKEFVGLQYTIGKSFVIGGLYNYYLTNDYSLIATIFF